MEEQWRDIIGYEGLYQISNFGRVKSLKYGKEKILKPQKNFYGYFFVHLCKNGKSKNKLIHRLVASAFIPNNDLSKTDINHKDENKENNFVLVNEDGTVDLNKSNLEWCDKAYNNKYGSRLERFSKSTINKHKKSKQVNQYSKDGKTLIKTWNSMYDIKKQLGFLHCNICQCCNGKLKSAYGFIWRYHN